MYYVIGADGKLNGPLSVSDIHQWLAEGRATKYSRVRREDTDEWQTLASVAELLPPRPTPPPAAEGAPSAPPRTLAELAAQFEARAAKLDASRCVSRGWALVRDNALLLVGSAVVVWSLIIGVAFMPDEAWVLGLLINYPLLGGLYFIYLERLRGEPARPEDLFRGFRTAFVPLVVACCICSGLTMLGMVLLIVPGIYLAVSYMFVVPLIIDKHLDVWTAMEISRRVVHRQWWTVCALALIASLIVLAGALAFGVGILLAVPVATGALMCAYEDLFPPA